MERENSPSESNFVFVAKLQLLHYGVWWSLRQLDTNFKVVNVFFFSFSVLGPHGLVHVRQLLYLRATF